MAGEKSQGAILAVSTAEAAADGITAATVANPVVITCGTHGIAEDSIVRITGAGGMTQINDRAFVFDSVTGTTGNLKGVNGTGYTAYTSGGSVFAQTMQNIGYVDSIGPGFNGQASEIDTTHLRSLAKEFNGGLPDFGEMPISFLDITDAGQTRLYALQESQAVVAWSITLSGGRVSAFLGFVKQCGFEAITPDSIVKGSAVIRVTNFPARFA